MLKTTVDKVLTATGALVFGLVQYMLPKSPAVIVIGTIVIAAVLVHPVLSLSESKRGRIAWVVALIVLCSILGWAAWPQPDLLVRVAPDRRFALHSGVEMTAYIRNESDVPAYSVWARMDILTPGIVANDDLVYVEIDDTIRRRPHPYRADLTIVQDAWWWPGWDGNNQESFFLVFREIPPRTTYQVVVSAKRLQKFEAIWRIWNYYREPFTASKDCHGLCMSFEVPAKVNIRSQGFWVLPKK